MVCLCYFCPIQLGRHDRFIRQWKDQSALSSCLMISSCKCPWICWAEMIMTNSGNKNEPWIQNEEGKWTLGGARGTLSTTIRIKSRKGGAEKKSGWVGLVGLWSAKLDLESNFSSLHKENPPLPQTKQNKTKQKQNKRKSGSSVKNTWKSQPKRS